MEGNVAEIEKKSSGQNSENNVQRSTTMTATTSHALRKMLASQHTVLVQIKGPHLGSYLATHHGLCC